MKRPLKREVLEPARDLFVRAAFWGLPGVMAAGGVALAVMAASSHARPTYVEVRAPARAEVAEPALVPLPLPLAVNASKPEPAAPSPPPTAGVRGFGFVFRAGGASYMALADLDSREGHMRPKLPRHKPFELYDGGDLEATSAVAEVAPAGVPERYRPWLGRRVRVDGGCEAGVTGFALVSRLTGDPAYYPGKSDGEHWSRRAVVKGGFMVLAARLDRCEGSFARDASLPPIVEGREVTQPFAATRAREDLLASSAAAEAQERWRDAGFEGSWSESARIEEKVVRHPETGETFVSVHAVEDVGCGGVGINLWGLYRVNEAGRPGRIAIRQLDDAGQIEKLIDLDGDGVFELVAEDWLGFDRILLSAKGEELERLLLPFYGCPC